MKNLILCADDYAQNTPISEGILLLAKNKKINAISCLTNASGWPEAARELLPLKKDVYLGLHLNFTLGQALSKTWRTSYSAEFGSLATLIKQSYLGRLSRECIRAEINAQLDAFSEALGFAPEFFDGHQHIHQLPGFRETLLNIYKQRRLSGFFRNTSSSWQDLLSWSSFPKRQAISLLGGLSLRQVLKRNAIQANSSFAGIYNFAQAQNYDRYFAGFLKQTQAGGLIMCHPGMESNDLSDPLYKYRPHELRFFMSEAFPKMLRKEQCHLAQKPLLAGQ